MLSVASFFLQPISISILLSLIVRMTLFRKYRFYKRNYSGCSWLGSFKAKKWKQFFRKSTHQFINNPKLNLNSWLGRRSPINPCWNLILITPSLCLQLNITKPSIRLMICILHWTNKNIIPIQQDQILHSKASLSLIDFRW